MNLAWVILAIAAAFFTGWCILRIFWPTDQHSRDGVAILMIRVCLAFGLGQAVAAIHYLLWRAACVNIGLLYQLADCVVVPILAWLASKVWGIPIQPDRPAEGLLPYTRHRSTTLLLATTILVASAALCICLAQTCIEPLGAWDAWAIWNLKARFMFRSGADWTGMFSRHIWFSHPDYPLLIPASVARLWTHLGLETTVVPQLLSVAYTTLVVGLLFASLAWLRGVVHACVGVLLLVMYEPFLTYGGAQMSDIPLSFYVLAAMVMLAISGRLDQSRNRLLILAGLLIGCAFIVKNEAQPIAMCLLLAMAIAALFGVRSSGLTLIHISKVAGKEGSASGAGVLAGQEHQMVDASGRPARTLALLQSARLQEVYEGETSGGPLNRLKAVLQTSAIPLLLLGVLPFLLVLAAQKLLFAGSSYLVADQPSTQAFVQKILDPARHRMIVQHIATWNFGFHLWRPFSGLRLALPLPDQPSFLLLLALGAVCGLRPDPRDRRAALTGIITVAMTFVIYYAVFLVMPYDLRTLLDSFPRVQLHFWPAMIFTVLLAMPIPLGRTS